MANFKELMRSFLYEEVDDDDEEYEEDEAPAAGAGFTVTTESVNGIPVAPAAENTAGDMDLAAQQAALQAAAMQQKALQEQMAKIQAEQQAAAAAQQASRAEEPVEQAPRSFGLSMDQVGRPDNKEETKPYRYDRRKLQTVRQKTVQGDYQAVLSPIFGNIEDDEKSFSSVHDAINLPRPEGSSEITMIISPMYGAASQSGKTRAPKEESVPEYKPKRKKAAPSKDEKSGPRDLADYLTKEPIAIPRPAQKEDE